MVVEVVYMKIKLIIVKIMMIGALIMNLLYVRRMMAALQNSILILATAMTMLVTTTKLITRVLLLCISQ